MNSNKLLSETITLLKRERSENYSIEDSMIIALDQAIKNLEKIRDSESCSSNNLAILLILGKLFEKFPEIKEFLQSLV